MIQTADIAVLCVNSPDRRWLGRFGSQHGACTQVTWSHCGVSTHGTLLCICVQVLYVFDIG